MARRHFVVCGLVRVVQIRGVPARRLAKTVARSSDMPSWPRQEEGGME